MARKIADGNSIQPLVEDFVRRIIAAVESATAQRVQSTMMSILASGAGGAQMPRRRGRPPKNPGLGGGLMSMPSMPSVSSGPPRPKQLCPVPNCSNPAAPVFGMVCAKHKDLPKAQIKKYRADRKAAKDKGGARSAGKSGRKAA